MRKEVAVLILQLGNRRTGVATDLCKVTRLSEDGTKAKILMASLQL